MELCRAVCSEECESQIHISMQRKNIFLCMEDPGYRLNSLALLDTVTDCDDGLDGSVFNDTYNCTVSNSTAHASTNDGDEERFCERLVVIECVRTAIPMVTVTTTTAKVNRGDDNSDGGEDDGGGSDDGAAAGAQFGARGNIDDDDDDDDDDDLVLGLRLQRPDDKPPCNVFIDVSMKELGK